MVIQNVLQDFLIYFLIKKTQLVKDATVEMEILVHRIVVEIMTMIVDLMRIVEEMKFNP